MGSSNAITTIPATFNQLMQDRKESLPLRETKTICVSKKVTAEISRNGAEMIAMR